MYKRIQRTVNKKIRTALRDYIREKCESCEKDFKSGNNHRMYKTVKELSTKKSTIATSVLDKGGKLLSDSEAIKDRWKSHFEEKRNPLLTCNPNVLSGFSKQECDPSPPPLLSEVKEAIHSLKKNKAPGPDGIPAELLKVGSLY